MRKVKAYITVFLSLIVGSLIVFIMTAIEGVRYQTIRMETECVMDAGLNSIFAEYNRELLKQYGMLFIDDSYGNNGSIDNVKEHLLGYMNYNFRINDTPKDLTALHADNGELSRVSFASDNKGIVLRYQINRYMKDKSGLSLVDKEMFDPFDEAYRQYDDYEQKRDALDEQIDGMIEDYNSGLPEEEWVDISNPSDAVEKLSSGSILYYACNDIGQLSHNVTDTGSLISNRQYNEGVGLYSTQESPYSAMDEALFHEYLFDKLAYKDKEKEGACLNYQIEYIIEGQDGDIENLEGVAERIFKLRYVVNAAHVFECAAKQQEAYDAAIIATSIIGQPELAEAVKDAILLAWAYAESAKDLRIVFDGYKLSAVKTEEEWNTPFAQITNFKAYLDQYKIPNGNISYKDYIYGFTLLTGREKKNMRLMDIMEMDIRLTPGNSHFMMNNQVYQLNAKINVTSKYGYSNSIERAYSFR